MRAKFANLNHCAVRFLSRAAANLCCYYITEESYLPEPSESKYTRPCSSDGAMEAIWCKSDT